MIIEQQLKQFVIENFLFGKEKDLKDDDSFFDQGIIDSTGVLELIAFLEERFEINVADTDLVPENLDSIRAVTAFVQRRQTAIMNGQH
jgi:acyl carrier protein